MDYSTLSVKLTKLLDISQKKNNGIFFTPPECIKKNIVLIKKHLNLKNNIKILEPSCGSCEYINAIQKYLLNNNIEFEITGIENNSKIYENIKDLYQNNINLINQDFLEYTPLNTSFDLILGNPPYFVLKNKEKFIKNSLFKDFINNRPNIFSLFIVKSLDLLKDGGILSFILPKSFTNCVYYNNIRKLINKQTHILELEECNDTYLETFQETIVLIVKKSINKYNTNKTYIFTHNNLMIFNTENKIKRLYSLYKNSITLYDLGFDIFVGNIVWNQEKLGFKETVNETQYKDKDGKYYEESEDNIILRKESEIFERDLIWDNENKKYDIHNNKNPIIKNNNHVRLIYSSDITNNKLECNKFKLIPNNPKKEYETLKKEYETELKEKIKLYEAFKGGKKYDETIYNNYIKNGGIFDPKTHFIDKTLPRWEEKKGLVKKKAPKIPIKDMVILINRGYGNAKYKLNYCILNDSDTENEYYIENHLYYIKYRNNDKTKKELKKLFKQIINTFESKRLKEFVDIYFGNGAINKSELNMLPIFNTKKKRIKFKVKTI